MNIRVYSDLHLFYDKDDMNRYIYTELNDLKNELLNNPPDYLVFCGDLCHKPYKSDDIRFINIINFITDVVNICTLKNINFRIIQGTSTHDGKIIQLLKYIFRDKPNVICFTEVGYEDVNGYVFRYLPESYFGKYESFYEYAFSKVADITFFHGSVDGVLPMVTKKDNITNLPKSIVIKREDLINHTRLFSVGGHIHKYINLYNKIFYTNSLTTHNFSDIDNVKGYMEFTLDDNYNWDYKYIRNDKAPKYVDYRIDNLQDKTKDELTGLISNLLINLNSKDKVRLSNKEYQMMEMLMRNPGNVIQTEQFLERIWGYDSDSEINVVWVNISYLRKKLKALDANVHIKATRNVGYTLEMSDV